MSGWVSKKTPKQWEGEGDKDDRLGGGEKGGQMQPWPNTTLALGHGIGFALLCISMCFLRSLWEERMHSHTGCICGLTQATDWGGEGKKEMERQLLRSPWQVLPWWLWHPNITDLTNDKNTKCFAFKVFLVENSSHIIHCNQYLGQLSKRMCVVRTDVLIQQMRQINVRLLSCKYCASLKLTLSLSKQPA